MSVIRCTRQTEEGVLRVKLQRSDEIIAHLESEVYVRVKRSAVQGIGVFAIRDIPALIDPFQEKKLGYEFTKIPAQEVFENPAIPEGVRRYVYDICSNRDGLLNFPCRGFNSITTLSLMNHSKSPNIRVREDLFFETIRKIREGEELTIDYGTFNDEVEIEYRALEPV